MSRTILGIFLASLLPVASADGATWSLGAHLGAGVLSSDVEGSGNSSVVGLSSNVLTYQPSLRLAAGTPRHAHEIALDTGLLLLDEGGDPLRLLVGTLNYQWSMRSRWRTSPIASAGLGLYHEGTELRSTTSATFGLGVGVRHVVRDEHGALRAEFRWDYLRAAHETGRPNLTTLGVRLGFDLWM